MEVNIISISVIALCLMIATFFILDKLQLSNMRKRLVLVSGCDRGFGKLLVRKLLSEGVDVIAGCLTDQGVSDLKTEYSGLLGSLIAIKLDVTSQDSVDNAARIVKENLPQKGLWAVVHNAGVMGPTGGDDFLLPADYLQVMDVNFLGAIRLTHAVKPYLKQARGRVVGIASVMGRVAKTNFAPYVVSKHALEAYLDCLRLEMLPFGVSVHILEPGGFKTELTGEDEILKRFYPLWERAPDKLKLEYGPDYVTGVEECVQGSVSRYCSSQLDWVTSAYYHAIAARFPRKRYWVGWDALFFFIPLSMTPTWFQVSLWRFLERAMKAPVPRVCRQN